MNWITIFKRKKAKVDMPEPIFEDNWRQEQYNRNVKQGVLALQNNRAVRIIDDGRGYELALDIKRQFILEYQKLLSERIRIDGPGTITIYFSSDTHIPSKP